MNPVTVVVIVEYNVVEIAGFDARLGQAEFDRQLRENEVVLYPAEALLLGAVRSTPSRKIAAEAS